mgnify:FL=1
MDKIALYREAALFMYVRAHMWHLNTKSSAAHMALNTFYTEMQDLIDAFCESTMAYEQNTMQPTGAAYRFDGFENAIPGLEQFLVISKQLHQELQNQPGLTNTLEDIITLSESTLYKLKHLH